MNQHRVLCSHCGDEFEDHALWQVEEPPIAKCPSCRVTTALSVFVSPGNASDDQVAKDKSHPNRLPAHLQQLHRSRRRAICYLSLVGLVFVVACGLPAVTVWEDLPPRSGLWCLFLGAPSCFAYLPNPLLLYGSIALLRGLNRRAFLAGSAACLCCVPIYICIVFEDVLHRLHSGFFLWQLDIYLFTMAAYLLTRQYGENPGLIVLDKDSH